MFANTPPLFRKNFGYKKGRGTLLRVFLPLNFYLKSTPMSRDVPIPCASYCSRVKASHCKNLLFLHFIHLSYNFGRFYLLSSIYYYAKDD